MTKFVGPVMCAVSGLCLLAQPALAGFQNNSTTNTTTTSTATPVARTYVSGAGSDSSSCSAPTTPCKTLQRALNLTTAGGEIFVLDSSNYGPVTINKSVSITSDGASAGILATSTTAITIAAGVSDVVNLKGVDLDGGNTAGTGIQFSSGAALNIQKSTVRGFTSSGISFTPSGSGALFVSDSAFSANGKNGVQISGAAGASATLSRVSASRNGAGILVNGSGVSVTLTNAVTNNNTYGVGVTGSAITVNNSTLSSNSVGIAADQSAVVQVSQSTITANGTGWTATNGAQVLSFGNNNVAGNTTDGTATSTLAMQ